MRIRNLAARRAALGVAALGLSGCATGLPTKVSRYSAVPARRARPSTSFPRRAFRPGSSSTATRRIVAQQLEAQGYRPAGAPQAADMLVQARSMASTRARRSIASIRSPARITATPSIAASTIRSTAASTAGPITRATAIAAVARPSTTAGTIRSGTAAAVTAAVARRDPQLHGLQELPGPRHRPPRPTTSQLFDGHAQARSQTDELGALVPNLIEAMFTGFPARTARR